LGRAVVSQGWLATSPIYAGYVAFTGSGRGAPPQFWTASGITLCYSLLALLVAAGILQRTWRDTPESETRGKFRERWQTWVTSAKDSRRRLRMRLLAQNPFAWVAARYRGPAVAAQILIFLVALAYVGMFWIAGLSWLTIGNALLASAVMHVGINWIGAYGAGKRFAEERQSGGFEVLLTTPLSVGEIVEGQIKGFIVQFKTTWCLAILLDLLLVSSNFLRGKWDEVSVIVYLAVWFILILLWFAVHLDTAARAMWISAWTGRPGYSAVQAMRAYLWSLFWIGFICQGALRSRMGFGAVAALVFFLPAVTLAAFGSRKTLREKLTRELRDIACAPIPARGDKRFKNWDSKRIFPPGRWGYFELHASDSTATWTRR
jgi:hypothetical protein